ncbi:AraC family transcriptional regulator [Geodermatophilus sabuli]|uniref:AraC-type DNA-binding protein n=1 Tax=Geodermatophilus sabuli TaxID=1564158 RepID=A0A285E6X0_9ACTN|nr:AraC family transcriptional regulator [Geodermatophilus sabuli]MBB3082517.1 AraC-like DNA-binding protein [Geodermatophilus sabuli]SNX94613.1 AraC-type DNA-binding protein [Geodermatophilus sabuli]
MKLNSYQNLRVANFSVHTLCRLLAEAGLDWRTALANADLDPDAVDRPGGAIPAEKELAFQLQFAALTRERPDLWVRAARAYTTSTIAVRGMALATAPTIAAWVEAASAADYAPGLLEITPLQTADGTLTGIQYTYPDAPEELIPFSVYRELFVTSRSFAWLYGGTFPFTRVDFPLPDVSPEVSAYVSCPINCGSETLQLWWDPATSTHELPFGNAFQHAAWVKADTEILDSFRATGDWPDTVARAVRAAPEHNRKLANVAATLRISPRTLQRKLGLTGHDFGQLRDQVLCDLASGLLSNTDHSVSRISRMLGYQDSASFTVAFKRWRGMPPGAYRQAARYRATSSSEARVY